MFADDISRKLEQELVLLSFIYTTQHWKFSSLVENALRASSTSPKSLVHDTSDEMCAESRERS